MSAYDDYNGPTCEADTHIVNDQGHPLRCDFTPSCVRHSGHLGHCTNAAGEEMTVGFAGRTPDREEELGGVGIAGYSERYRIVDGRLQIWFASDRTWIQQKRSRWDTIEKWQEEAGHHRQELAKARALITLFESTRSGQPHDVKGEKHGTD